MSNDSKGFTRPELRSALRGVGLRVSEVQLEQWHKRGLLSSPKRRSLGRGKGMESRYPDIALLEAAAIAVARRDVGRLDLIGWYLWCFGFPGRTPRARALLSKLLDRRLQKSTDAMAQFEAGVLGNPIERVRDIKLHGLLGRIRSSVGREFMPSLERLCTEIDLGWTEWIDGAEAGDFGQLMRVADAVDEGGEDPDTVSTAIEKVGLGKWRKVMHRFVEGLDLRSVLVALDKVDDRSLERMRDELQTIMTVWDGLLGRDTLLAQPDWFLLYFTLRHASKTWSPAVSENLQAMHRAGQLPTPAPPPLVQLVRQSQAEQIRKPEAPLRPSRSKQ